MNLKNALLTAAFGLIMSAFSAQSADIPITSLPFNITAPGSYVLTGDLTFTPGGPGAINITAQVAGPVVVDLKGFTITGPTENFDVSGVLIGNYGAYNAYPITVRNGTIKNFVEGITINHQTDVTIKNIAIYQPAAESLTTYGVYLWQSTSSTIHNCTFGVLPGTPGFNHGIEDLLSTGGNSYDNNKFISIIQPLHVQAPIPSTLVLNRCQFDDPPAP
jgi:hypothetical protein